MTHPYVCKYCGTGSWIEPCDQEPPPDYCHPSDHGNFEDYAEQLDDEDKDI